MATVVKPTALITGACGGMGRRIAQQLTEMGCQLILVDIHQDGLDKMRHQYSDALIQQADLSSLEQTEQLCQYIESLTQTLDIAFVNAGIVIPGNVTDLKREQLNQEIHINLRSAINLNHACAVKMKQQGNGHIINTASMAALVALKGTATYSATKFGLRGFLIALRAELKPHNVAVSIILPSGIDTPMLRFEAVNGGSALNFLNKPKTVDDIAHAFVKALKQKKLEYYVPFSDSISGRLVCVFPWLMDSLYPLMEWLGEKGREKFIKQHQLTKSKGYSK